MLPQSLAASLSHCLPGIVAARPSLEGGSLDSSWFLMPNQSVLSPYSFPSSDLVMVFTAPITFREVQV